METLCSPSRPLPDVAFAVLPFQCVALDDGAEHVHGAFDGGAGGIQAVEPGAVVAGAEVERVFVRGFSDEADFAEVGAGAAVRATGDAGNDMLVANAMFAHHRLDFIDE